MDKLSSGRRQDTKVDGGAPAIVTRRRSIACACGRHTSPRRARIRSRRKNARSARCPRGDQQAKLLAVADVFWLLVMMSAERGAAAAAEPCPHRAARTVAGREETRSGADGGVHDPKKHTFRSATGTRSAAMDRCEPWRGIWSSPARFPAADSWLQRIMPRVINAFGLWRVAHNSARAE